MGAADERAPESVRRVVSQVFGTSVRSCRRPAVGSVAETYLLELEGNPERVVCKVGGASVWTGAVIEPAVCRLVGNRTALAVPDVLASGRFVDAGRTTATETAAPLSRWALYEYVDGESPDPWYSQCDRTVRRRLVSDAGSILGRLHDWSTTEFAFDRTGGLERTPNHPTGLCVCDSTPPSVVDALAAVSQVLPRRSLVSQAVLCHGDFHPGNLLVTSSGRITAVLDWGNAHVAPAEYAVARAEVRFIDRFRSLPSPERARLREVFRARYRDHVSLESDYPARAPLYKSLWLAQSAINLASVARSSRGRTQIRRQLRTIVDR